VKKGWLGYAVEGDNYTWSGIGTGAWEGRGGRDPEGGEEMKVAVVPDWVGGGNEGALGVMAGAQKKKGMGAGV